MENNKYRNTNDINDAEYRQMRKSEDSSYEYHGADAEDIDEANADNGYPEVVEHNESGSVYDLKTDYIVLLPDEIIRIPQDSNLAWMTMYSWQNKWQIIWLSGHTLSIRERFIIPVRATYGGTHGSGIPPRSRYLPSPAILLPERSIPAHPRCFRSAPYR